MLTLEDCLELTCWTYSQRRKINILKRNCESNTNTYVCTIIIHLRGPNIWQWYVVLILGIPILGYHVPLEWTWYIFKDLQRLFLMSWMENIESSIICSRLEICDGGDGSGCRPIVPHHSRRMKGPHYYDMSYAWVQRIKTTLHHVNNVQSKCTWLMFEDLTTLSNG